MNKKEKNIGVTETEIRVTQKTVSELLRRLTGAARQNPVCGTARLLSSRGREIALNASFMIDGVSVSIDMCDFNALGGRAL